MSGSACRWDWIWPFWMPIEWGVLGVDTVVVEGWSSCFVVGLVLGVGQDGYFGELVLAPVGLLGDA